MYRNESSNKHKLIIGLLMVVLIVAAVVLMQSGRSMAETHPTIHISSPDPAPVTGVIAVHVQYGENNAPEGWLIGKWEINAGQQIDTHVKIPSGKYARVWFRPANSMTWTLLPSQYWHGGGACGDEFGVSARSDNPSYHTYFAQGIAEKDVPLLTRLDECPHGSFTYNQPVIVVPVATLVPTPVPSPTLCVVLRSGTNSGCGG